MLQGMKFCEYYCTICSCFQPWNMYVFSEDGTLLLKHVGVVPVLFTVLNIVHLVGVINEKSCA